MKGTAKIAAAALTALWIAGCAVKQVPPTRYYALDFTPSRHQTAQTPRFDTLKIVTADPTRIALSTALFYRRDNLLQPYAYSRWSETPLSMVENILAVALKEAHVARHVVTADSRARADALLEISLLDFSQLFTPHRPSAGHMLLKAALIDPKTGQVIRSRLFEASREAPTPDAEGGVTALQRCTEAVIAEMTAWLAQR